MWNPEETIMMMYVLLMVSNIRVLIYSLYATDEKRTGHYLNNSKKKNETSKQ